MYRVSSRSGGVSWRRSFNELLAYAREKIPAESIPTKFVVFNYRHWGEEKKNLATV